MRLPQLLSIAAIAVGSVFVFQPAPADAQDRSCAGGCDRYGSPIYEPRLPDDSGLVYRPRRANETNQHLPRYEGESAVGEPVYIDPPEYRRERRTRRHRARRVHRQHRRRYSRNRHHSRQVGRRSYVPDYSNRTKFCRERIERRGDGWGRRKVKVRRCVLVRNDLLSGYRSNRRHRRYSDDW